MTKKNLRIWARQNRDAIAENYHHGKNEYEGALHHFIQNHIPQAASIIGTYMPIASEIKPPHNIQSKQMALPVIRNKTTLEFYLWNEGDRLITRDFNIPIPDTRGLNPVVPDVILLPLLLCDRHGNRIGYGAGHYDRYIATIATNKRPYLIGVCFDEQIYDGKIPCEDHDIPLNLIITPQRVIEIS